MKLATDNRQIARRWASIGVLTLMLGAGQALAAWSDSHGLMINTSESLPNWAFFVEKKEAPKVGDYIVFAPPKTPLVVAHFGAESAAFTKLVYGAAGDVVSRSGSQVAVNGKVVGQLKPLSKRGEVLEPGPVGVVPRGCYYVGTPHKDGFDSRYAAIGFVCGRQIAGTGVPIL